MKPHSLSLLAPFLGASLLLGGCMVGPDYKRPDAPAEAGDTYESLPPETWKKAAPNDAAVRGAWWEIYGDPGLNALEAQVSISNQNVLIAEAQFRQAIATVRVTKADLYPQVGVSPSVTANHGGGGGGSGGGGGGGGYTTGNRTTTWEMPATLSWEIDLWGEIRRGVERDVATAQASAAQLENARLSYQATLASDWFALRGLDGQIALLQDRIKSYQQYLELTNNRYNAGVSSQGDVAAAEAQLEAAKVTLVDDQLSRAQYEHALAILVGKPPSGFHIAANPLLANPPVPAVPVGVPSSLLQRRPDIAQAERQVAAANAAIGVATGAYYPALTLSASVGYQDTVLENLFHASNFFWSVGPALAQSVFDAGRTHAQVLYAKAGYEAQAATYRQAVLTAFQQIEDDLTGLRFLEMEASAQTKAVKAADQSLQVTTNQYQAGTLAYLDVITAQNVALSNEVNALSIATRRMQTSVLLVQALGGGWSTGDLPNEKKVSTVPGNPIQNFPAAAAVTGQAH